MQGAPQWFRVGRRHGGSDQGAFEVAEYGKSKLSLGNMASGGGREPGAD